MYSSMDRDTYIEGSHSTPESDSSETPSELEARLFSVLHYNDLTQPLPPDIASEYSVSISGTDVCISVNKNLTSSSMTENNDTETETNSSSHQRSINSDVCDKAFSKATDTVTISGSKSRNLSKNAETNINTEDDGKREQFDGDQSETLSAYVTYLTWMSLPSPQSRLVRKIVRALPYPHADSASYAACKELVRKYAEPVLTTVEKMKEEKLSPNVLKTFFSQFVKEACVPRDVDDSVAILEFSAKLSPVNAVCFQLHCKNTSSKLYHNICHQFSNRKKLVRKVILKKFQLFVDELPIGERSKKEECVETFCAEPHCLLSEAILLNDPKAKKQFYDICENSMIFKGQKVSVTNDNLCADSQEDSIDDLCDDAVPTKKRKLEDGKEELISQVSNDNACAKSGGSKSDLHNFLLEHNPDINEKDALFKIFNQFHEFSMKEKFTSGSIMKKHKFVKVFAKYSGSVNCFNTLYCGLIDESLFRELFIFGNNYWNEQRQTSGKAIDEMIEVLVKKALSTNSSRKPEGLDKGSSENKMNRTSSSNTGQDDPSKDVIILSGDDSDVELVSSSSESCKSSVNTSSAGNIWINSNKNSSCSSQNEQSFTEGNKSLVKNDSRTQSFDFLNSQVNGYSLICPPSWSKEMISYYCQSWGGETFDHFVVLKEMKATTKPSDWKVTNYQDLIPSRKRKRGQQCNRCLQWGHLQYQCKEPTKPVVCSICGVFNHVQSACKDTKCLRCGARSKKFSDFCQVCVDPSKDNSKPKCTLCESDKHERTFCPDTWRSYHLTVEGSIVVPPDSQMNPRQYCCNCAKAGHLDYYCPLLKKSNTLNVVNSPFVSNYNVEKLREDKHKTSDHSNSDRHLSLEKTNPPKPKDRRHEHRMHYNQKPYQRQSHSSFNSSPRPPHIQNFRSRSFHF